MFRPLWAHSIRDYKNTAVLAPHNLLHAGQLPFGNDMMKSWSDGDDARLERQLAEIATEILLHAEVRYRESVVRHYEWRVERKAQLEEERRRRKLEAERAEREHIKRLEQARTDRLLADAAALQQASIIRDYVPRESDRPGSQPLSRRFPGDELERWKVNGL